MDLNVIETEHIVSDIQRLKFLTYKVQEHRLREVWNRFADAGFKPLLIKGWAAAQFYTKPEDRFYNDVDLIINPTEYEKAVEFAETIEGNTAIDLHKNAKILDTLSYENLYENSIVLKCGETHVRVPRPEDHLRILSVHWLNDGGAKKDKLWDIYYAVANRPKDFDWNRCLNSVSPLRKKWIVCAIGLAQKYLDLDLRDTPFERQKIEIPTWLIKALEKEWRSGTIIIPMHFVLNDKKELWRQMRKRIPPNAIQATVEMEGAFDRTPRIFYQAGDILLRLAPSFKRIYKSFTEKNKIR